MRRNRWNARSTRSLMAAGAVVLTVAPFAACGDDDDSASTTTTPSDATTTTESGDTSTSKGSDDGAVITASGPVTLAKGETATIELEGNVTTGYTWTVTQEPDAAVAKVVSNEYVAPEGGAVGAGGHQKIVLEGVADGTTTLDLAYSREWETDVAPAETAKFEITVG